VPSPPDPDVVAAAYSAAVDPISIREEVGQVETARRALERIEQIVSPGRMVDIGCWTGSFVSAASDRGWRAEGIEPSRWAVERACQRGLDVKIGGLEDNGLTTSSYGLVVLTDVLEHLADPLRGLRMASRLLEPGGAVFATVPDAGSVVARVLGRRWWSVLPMHLQYFTRHSLTTLFECAGLSVRDVRRHPKVFTARYYAERLGGYQPSLARAAGTVLDRIRLADRLVAPNFRDRLAIVASMP
jgi:2-polyprenyl-3-methyl-5-hydroxy-6-metoxy-1,4-benzoquinol methylase